MDYTISMIKCLMNIFKIIITTFLFSCFIYLEYFGISNKFINTIFALLSFYFLLTINKKELFLSGFFISILWFWWIGYSFVHYDLGYLIPFVLIGIGTIYGVLFYIGAIINNLYFRTIYLFFLSMIYPFGFNWLQLELVFINSYIGTSKLDFALVLSSIILIIKLKNYKKYLSIIPLLFAINYQTQNIELPNLKISLANTKILQKNKWDKKYLSSIIDINFDAINSAIKNKNDLIILPETTLPLILNKNDLLLIALKEKSKQIAIIAGSLHKENNTYHNSTYFFENGKMQVAHKVVLIPFGEAVPLPKKLKDFINNTFYNGAKDYEASLNPTDFTIKGATFRNAICYEATTDKIFENLKGKYMIALSNNAWFTPSIQPTLQNLLLKYYAKKYNVKIFSCTNMSENKIIN